MAQLLNPATGQQEAFLPRNPLTCPAGCALCDPAARAADQEAADAAFDDFAFDDDGDDPNEIDPYDRYRDDVRDGLRSPLPFLAR